MRRQSMYIGFLSHLRLLHLGLNLELKRSPGAIELGSLQWLGINFGKRSFSTRMIFSMMTFPSPRY